MFETPKVTTSEENNDSTEVGFPPDTTPNYHSKAKMKGKESKINEEDEFVDEANQEDVEETNQEEKNGVITQEQDTEIEQEEQDQGVSQEGPITEINQDIQKKYHTIQESQEYQTTQDYGDDITQEPQEYQPSPQYPVYNQYQQGQGYLVLPAIRNKPIIQSNQTNEISPLKIYKEIQYGQQIPDYQNFQQIGNGYEYQYNQYQYVAQSPEYQQNQYYLQNTGYYQQNQFNGFSEEQTNNRYNDSPEISQTSQNISETNNTKEAEVKERKKKKSQPKDSLSKVIIPTRSGKKFLAAIASMKKKEQSKYNKEQKTSSKTGTSSTTSNKITKKKFNINKEKMSEFVEIPRNEYKKYANNLTLVLEGGINTGKYKFSGNESIVEEDLIPGRRYKLSEQEIEDELIRRYREKKKSKI